MPAFGILYASVIIEIILLALWKKDDFVMCDARQDVVQVVELGEKEAEEKHKIQQDFSHLCDSSPSSLGGTMRLGTKSATALRNMFTLPDDQLLRRLKAVEDQAKDKKGASASSQIADSAIDKVADIEKSCELAGEQQCENKNKNPQMVIFRLILSEDARLIKYLILFTIFGILLAPMNFVFLSLDDLCRERGYNFSQLAGSVLISQAAIETLSFLVLPWFMARVSKSLALGFALAILTARFAFYGGYFYTTDVSIIT